MPALSAHAQGTTMRTADLLGEIERLTDGNKLARPVATRDRSGRWHRATGAEWDWFYSLPETERTYIQRHYMVDNGLGPDELATWLDCSVDDAMAKWLDAVRAARKPLLSKLDPLSDEYLSGPEVSDFELLIDQIHTATAMSDAQWSEVIASVQARFALVPTPTGPDCGAPEQSERAQKLSSWVTQAELARVMGIPAVNVRQWHARGKLPKGERVGNRTVWSRKTARRFLDDLAELDRAQAV